MATHPMHEATVAIMIDCDNVSPDIVGFALRMAVQAGRVTVRRGYGNRTTLSGKWQDTLVEQAFTPCLQFQYAAKKNTADIALALEAFEVLFDKRADAFCLVTSDSDFAYLCRKLRERGATVYIVGEDKTPLALRNACDQFFEWKQEVPPEVTQEAPPTPPDVPDAKKASSPAKPEVKVTVAPPKKPLPGSVVEAVSLLASSSPDGKVTLTALGQYLKRADPTFNTSRYGHSGLLNMVKAYTQLKTSKATGGQWTVSLAAKTK